MTPSHKEPACPSHKSHPYWSSASPTLTSSSRVSIMNRSKVQLWGQTSSWKSWKLKPLVPFPTPSLWLRFVDDTFVINKAEHSQDLLQHINNQDPYIQFTVEPTQQGSLPFLDTHVTIEPDNTFSTTVYRKPTHTDQYLHWDSNHHITAKQSVFNTLAHWAKIISSTKDKMDRELQHIKTAQQHCQFPSWALNQWEHKFTHPNQHNTTTTNNNNSSADNNKNNVTIVVPYMPNTGEKFKKSCKKKGIQVHFKGTNTLRTALGNPKHKDPKNNQTGIIYHYQCPQINCPSTYIGESGRSLGERVKEHFKAPSPIQHHYRTPTDPDQFNIVHKDVNSHSRTIKEAMFIWVQDPTLNRNLGKYQLLHIWDHLLQASPTLQCKPSTIQLHPQPPNPLLVLHASCTFLLLITSDQISLTRSILHFFWWSNPCGVGLTLYYLTCRKCNIVTTVVH